MLNTQALMFVRYKLSNNTDKLGQNTFESMLICLKPGADTIFTLHNENDVSNSVQRCHRLCYFTWSDVKRYNITN